MSEITQIVEELDKIHHGDAWHGLSLREALAGLTAEQAAARPLANAHTIWELVSHISAWEKVWRVRLGGQALSEPQEGDFPQIAEADEVGWMKTLAKLKREHEDLLGAIEKLSDANLEDTVAGQAYSVGFLLRGIVRHHVYHVGQITLLKKAFTGDK
jgi:uncharacterized damage-inducible protein DinB